MAFQFGHSKDHRPDLPQLKINQSVLDPLGIPLTTTIVSGEKADDPFYIPGIRKVQNSLMEHGVLYLQVHIKEAQTAITKLNQRGRGIKMLDEKELHAAVDTLLKKHTLQSVLQIEYRREEKKTLQQATRKSEAYILVETSITVHSTLNQDALENVYEI